MFSVNIENEYITLNPWSLNCLIGAEIKNELKKLVWLLSTIRRKLDNYILIVTIKQKWYRRYL